MISKAEDGDECYVYIYLPESVQAVTAGRLRLRRNLQGVTTGQFVYGREYLKRPDAVEVDPVHLQLSRTRYDTVLMEGIFGALRDAGPDYWGRRIIEKHAGVSSLRELDYLLLSADDRAGALGFGIGKEPPAPVRHFNKTIELARLQALADLIVSGEQGKEGNASFGSTQMLEELLLIGTSMGGARPKAVVEDGEGLWLAKFNRTDDRWDNARVEHAMLVLGRLCGLTTAESRIEQVAGRSVLLVKRFDRKLTAAGADYHRSRMVSALTLLGADESLSSRNRWSYLTLVEILRRITDYPEQNAHELFRRVCFNALISNTDDHPRNHAIIAPHRSWFLAPAYDLNPSIPSSIERRELAMECGNMGRYANARNLLSQSARFFLSESDARAIIENMEKQIVTSWYDVARRSGVTEHDCQAIAPAFAYPGFRM
jgi:serine/threonine-protein kinase HipA